MSKKSKEDQRLDEVLRRRGLIRPKKSFGVSSTSGLAKYRKKQKKKKLNQ